MLNKNTRVYFFKDNNISSGIYAGTTVNGSIVIIENGNHMEQPIELNESIILYSTKKNEIDFYKLIINRTKQILSTCMNETHFDLLGQRYTSNNSYLQNTQVLNFLLEIINNEKQRFYRYLIFCRLPHNTTLNNIQRKALNNFRG